MEEEKGGLFKEIGNVASGAMGVVKNAGEIATSMVSKAGTFLETLPITMQMSAFKGKIMKVLMDAIKSLKGILDKNNESVAKAKETISKEGLSGKKARTVVAEATKNTDIFKDNSVTKAATKSTQMPKNNDIGKLVDSATPNTKGMALAGKVGPSTPDVGLDKV